MDLVQGDNMSDVSTQSIVCKESEENRRLERTLMGGTKAIRKAGKAFTPSYPNEDEDSYKMRLNGATLFNGFEDTVKKMVGKVLAKDIVLGEDVPPTIKEYCTNIDGQGRNITAFALDAFREAMVDGISYIFVDFPVVKPAVEGEKPFLSDQKAQGARPISILYTADQIVGFKHENRGGQEVLTQIRIRETIVESEGEFGESQIDQIRVLNIGSFQIWRRSEVVGTVEKWELFDEGVTTLNKIPIVPVYVNRVGYMIGSPALKSLAELNLEHWISSTDQRKALTFARFAMMVFAGVKPGSIGTVGPDMVVELMESDAKWGKIESSGEGIVAGRLDLEAIEKKMEHTGMVIHVQNSSGDITATAASINSEEANAALLAAAGGLEDSLDQMLQLHAEYEALPTGGSVTVNKGFGKRRSTATVVDLINLFNSGLLDDLTVLTELQERGDLNNDIDLEEVKRRLRENTPNLLGQGGNLGGQGGIEL